MTITYAQEPPLSVQEFHALLVASTLGERRPVQDRGRLEKMLRHANLIVTAREEGELVGVSRALTDFSFCCYLSDLAVAKSHQHKGIGKRLVEETHKAAGGPQTLLVLLSAPAAEAYYPKIGMKPVANGWMIPRTN